MPLGLSGRLRSGARGNPDLPKRPESREGRFGWAVLAFLVLLLTLAGIAGSDNPDSDTSLPPGIAPENVSVLPSELNSGLESPYAFVPDQVWWYYLSLSPSRANQYIKAVVSTHDGGISYPRLEELVWYVNLVTANESRGVAGYHTNRLIQLEEDIGENGDQFLSRPTPPIWILFYLGRRSSVQDTAWMMDFYDEYNVFMKLFPPEIVGEQLRLPVIRGAWWDDDSRLRKAMQYSTGVEEEYLRFLREKSDGFTPGPGRDWQISSSHDAIRYSALWAALTPDMASELSDIAMEYKDPARKALLFWFHKVLADSGYSMDQESLQDFAELTPVQRQRLLSLLTEEDWRAIRWLLLLEHGTRSGVATDVLMQQLFGRLGVTAEQLPESYFSARQRPFAWEALWVLDLKLAQVVDVVSPYGDKDLESDTARGHNGFYLGVTSKVWGWLNDEEADLVERSKRWDILLAAMRDGVDTSGGSLPPYIHDMLLVWRQLSKEDQEALARLLELAKLDQVGGATYQLRSDNTGKTNGSNETTWTRFAPDGSGGFFPVPSPIGDVSGVSSVGIDLGNPSNSKEPRLNGVRVGGPFTIV